MPLALAAPLALRIGWARDWLRPKVVLAFCAIALPWYVVCYSRNGWPFVQEFFVKHHFGRFASLELQHGRPWWFYLALLPLLLLPWLPLLGLVVPAERMERAATAVPGDLGGVRAGDLLGVGQ